MNNGKKIKDSKYSFIDLFAGAGGFSLGFELENFNLICALEKDPWACDTLASNHESRKVINEDIRSITKAPSFDKNPSIIIGGPPCQGFSVAGPAKDPNDPRNTLFMNFAQWVSWYDPEVFVMENVKGILTRKNKNGELIINIILNTFNEIGYSVEIWKLNAVDYGVPQFRERVFLVGNKRGDLIGEPKRTHSNTSEDNLPFPITVGEAILDLPQIQAGEGRKLQSYTQDAFNDYQVFMRLGSEFVHNHEAMKHTHRLIERYKLIQVGTAFESIPEIFKVRQRNGQGEISSSVYNSNYRHLNADLPSHTIPASFYSSFIHPVVPRNITAREAARIQSFPDYYEFKGKRTLISKKLLKRQGKDYYNYLSQYNQIGNAVPPLLAKSIAKHIQVYLDNQNIESSMGMKIYLNN